MIELLITELENVGLHINAEKTKILHSNFEDDDADKDYADINGEFVQILHDDNSYRYLGRHLSLSFEKRSDIEFKHRKDQAWAAFHKHKKTLLNAHISLRKRLKPFRYVHHSSYPLCAICSSDIENEDKGTGHSTTQDAS